MSAKTTTKPETTKKTTNKKVAPVVAPVKREPKPDRATIIGQLLMKGGSPEEIATSAQKIAKGKVRTDKRDVIYLGNILVKCGILKRDNKGIYKKV